MARPQTYLDNTVVAVSGKEAKSRLQSNSERRAIIDRVVGCGGKMTMGELDGSFGYDIRVKVISLINSGWLEVVE